MIGVLLGFLVALYLGRPPWFRLYKGNLQRKNI